mgnify:CR=1 FL=1
MNTTQQYNELKQEIEKSSYIGNEDIWNNTRGLKDVPTINIMMNKAALAQFLKDLQRELDFLNEEIEFLEINSDFKDISLGNKEGKLILDFVEKIWDKIKELTTKKQEILNILEKTK